MTTQEAIYKLENYDELEGKYNEALARIDEYERERAEYDYKRQLYDLVVEEMTIQNVLDKVMRQKALKARKKL